MTLRPASSRPTHRPLLAVLGLMVLLVAGGAVPAGAGSGTAAPIEVAVEDGRLSEASKHVRQRPTRTRRHLRRTTRRDRATAPASMPAPALAWTRASDVVTTRSATRWTSPPRRGPPPPPFPI